MFNDKEIKEDIKEIKDRVSKIESKLEVSKDDDEKIKDFLWSIMNNQELLNSLDWKYSEVYISDKSYLQCFSAQLPFLTNIYVELNHFKCYNKQTYGFKLKKSDIFYLADIEIDKIKNHKIHDAIITAQSQSGRQEVLEYINKQEKNNV